jgi:hypothetical protein
MVERESKRAELPFVPARPESEDEPPSADLVNGIGHLGEQRRIAPTRAGDERAQSDPVGDGRDRGEQRPPLPHPGGCAIVGVEHQMIGNP